MDDDTGRGRRPGTAPGLRRARWLAAALAATALLAAACGGGGSPPLSNQQAAYQAALAYSQCMRTHGEPGYPDPLADGKTIVNGPKDHLNGALMNSANKACQHLAPKSTPLTGAQQRQLTAKALKFVACMRAHGLPNMPDPTVNAQGIEFQIGGSGQIGSQVFKSAQQTCRKLIPFGLP